jgi:hypothetical protein
VDELSPGVAKHDPEEAAASPSSEREESGIQVVAFAPEYVDRLAARDPCVSARTTADDRLRSGACLGGLFREALDEVARQDARVEGWSGVKGGHCANVGGVWGEHERLAQRLEAPVSSVDPDDNAVKHAEGSA